MEQRLANTWRMTVNERKFIETALQSDIRVDGRKPFDYRGIRIKLREDGSSEVHLGKTQVMGFVSAQLVQPYRDRPNEGTLSIFTEFSPMADPAFEIGRPGDYAVELARVIDRGLRESRAVDTESLCVLAGKLVWSIRVDLHILDNGGNLVDAANIAALSALLTFRRPECSLGGEDGQEVIVHPPEAREPITLIIHHLPIAVTFAFFGNDNIVVIDPCHNEEAVMGGRMTATLNANGDVCAIQKGGGDSVIQSVIMQCLRIASIKAADITSKIKNAVEAYSTERTLRKIKRHSTSVAVDVDHPDGKRKGQQDQPINLNQVGHLPKQLEIGLKEKRVEKNMATEVKIKFVQKHSQGRGDKDKRFSGGLSSWDPYTKGIDPDIYSSLPLPDVGNPIAFDEHVVSEGDQKPEKTKVEKFAPELRGANIKAITLEDAVKPRTKKKKKAV